MNFIYNIIDLKEEKSNIFKPNILLFMLRKNNLIDLINMVHL